MKFKIYILGFLLAIFACRNGNQPEDIPEGNENGKQADEPATQDYLIRGKAAGTFRIGDPIPYPVTSGAYEISKEIQTRVTEEGPLEETVYVVSEKGEDLLILKPQYEPATGEYTAYTGEIIVLSGKFKTGKGIGVNSTIEEFIKTYPSHKLWYTYVSGMYVLESEDTDAQFLLDAKDFTGEMEVKSEVTQLKASDFRSGARIVRVRII